MDIAHHPALIHPTAYIAPNATLMGREALGAAGALVTEGMVIPPRHLVLEAPARVVRAFTGEEIEHACSVAADYVAQAQAFLAASQGG